jgi:protein-disulfide isomerase
MDRGTGRRRRSALEQEKSMNKPTLSMSVALFLASSCGGTDQKLDALTSKIDALDKKVDALSAKVAGGQARPPQRPQLDPSAVYAVPVSASDAYVGAKHAKVTIVEAYEFACPYCRMAAEVIDKVVEARGKDVKVVGKQFVVHPQIATNASLAVCAANKQAKYGALSQAIWKSAWSAEGRLDTNKLTPESLEQTAQSVGLDTKKLKTDMASCAQEIERDQRELATLGVGGTPAFFINGRPYSGPRTVEGFGAVIDEEIKKADEAIRSGTKLEDYYASIVRNGKKSL